MPPVPESRAAIFLMTDIEGSTRLWEAEPAGMAVALAAHDALLRAATEAAGGTVFKTTGDGMLAAFETPRGAVEAAAAAQRALAGQAWPTTIPIRVRMAIHAGSAEARDGDFFGPSINRVARLLAIGHGGQVLLSSSGAAMAADVLPDGMELLDRGEHRLKDLARMEHVFQLAAPGLRAEFPPLRSGRAASNLPAELTSFVGREHEVQAVRDLLGTNRLVSLVGVGGTGKTRLMLRVAGELVDRYPDGAWVVELAPLSDPGLVLPEVARALVIPDSPGQPLLAAVTDFLREKDLLLLVDNCEHLIGAVADLVRRLLADCRALRILATSREGLGVPGESIFQVPSLAIPEALDHSDLAAAAGTEAVRLFVDRATGTLPAFRLDSSTVGPVVEICRRLDGIPLALELAAARVNVLTAEEISDGLGDRFRLLTGGRRTAVPRQQTLQAMIDWSWDLLEEPDQQLMRRLSVFAGGWTLEAAAEVTGDGPAGVPAPGMARIATLDGLGRLVDRSLVVAEHVDGTRFKMLETIRQYARDRLITAVESTDLRTRHLARFRRVVEEAGPALNGPDMMVWLERLDTELDNIRVALDWAFEADPEAGAGMIADLGTYWRARSIGAEGVDRLVQAVEALRALPDPGADRAIERMKLASRLLAAAARESAMTSRRVELAGGWADEGVRLARESGDMPTLTGALTSQSFVLMFTGHSTDEVLAAQAELAGLAEAAGDWMSATFAAASRSESLISSDPVEAEAWAQRGVDAARRSGNPFAIGLASLSRGRFLGYWGRIDEARPLFADAVTRYHNLADQRMELVARSDLAHALRRARDLAAAEAEYRAVLPQWLRLGHRGAVANLLESFAFIAVERGATSRAAVLFGAAERLRAVSGASMLAHERAEYDAYVSRMRAALDPAASDRSWAEGAGFTTDEAVAFAIGG